MLEFFAPTPKRGRKNKYNAVRVLIDGVWFDSKGEGSRYVELKQLQRAAEIAQLRTHPRYPLVVERKKVAVYESDFEYVTKAGELITEDWKPGVMTALAQLKINLFEAIYKRPVLLSGRKV